jgi:uncharacterized membrane protein YfcA
MYTIEVLFNRRFESVEPVIMPFVLPWYIYPCFLVVAFLYGSVGLGGATGYLAILSLFGMTEPIIAPSVLLLNILVAGISFGHFYREGFFRMDFLLPFAVTSIPASLVGGMIPLSRASFVLVLGATLLVAGVRLMVLPEMSEESGPKLTGRAYWATSLSIGIGLGLLSGVTGSGGGFLLIPVLILFYRIPPKPTAAAAAGFVVVNSVAGFAGHLLRGHVSWELTGSLVVVVLVGGFAGARMGSTYWEASTVQQLISVVLVVGGGKLLVEFMWMFV